MSFPGWISALGVTLLMQAVASFLGQSLPVIAPLITANAGMSPESIGHLSALVAGGTVVFLLLGGPFLTRWGPVRTLQIGAGVSALGMLLAGFGTPAALLLASLLLGIGYGPSPPARRAPRAENAWFAFGHAHICMCGAATTGREIAHLVAGRVPEIDLSAFSPTRFSRAA